MKYEITNPEQIPTLLKILEENITKGRKQIALATLQAIQDRIWIKNDPKS